jgi:hypothetical protein
LGTLAGRGLGVEGVAPQLIGQLLGGVGGAVGGDKLVKSMIGEGKYPDDEKEKEKDKEKETTQKLRLS